MLIDINHRILYEQDRWVVIDKPPGLPSTGKSLDDPDCAQHLLMQRHRRMVWAVHQLDAQTSGVNIFVTRKSKVQIVTRRLAASGRKRYIAICHGTPRFSKKRVTKPVGWVEELRMRGVTPDGQRAISDFEVLALNRETATCVLQATIQTGRTHQI